MENNHLELKTVQAILDRGVRYTLPEGDKITVRPLKFGTTLTICETLCKAGLTLQSIKEGDGQPEFIVKYGSVMLESVAIAILNDRKLLENEILINEKASFLKEHLTAFQIYELFEYVVSLSGMESFTSTIRLMWTIKTMNLSPRKNQGSYME